VAFLEEELPALVAKRTSLGMSIVLVCICLDLEVTQAWRMCG